MEHPKYPAALAALNDLFNDTSVSRAETLAAIEDLLAEAEVMQDDLNEGINGDDW